MHVPKTKKSVFFFFIFFLVKIFVSMFMSDIDLQFHFPCDVFFVWC